MLTGLCSSCRGTRDETGLQSWKVKMSPPWNIEIIMGVSVINMHSSLQLGTHPNLGITDFNGRRQVPGFRRCVLLSGHAVYLTAEKGGQEDSEIRANSPRICRSPHLPRADSTYSSLLNITATTMNLVDPSTTLATTPPAPKGSPTPEHIAIFETFQNYRFSDDPDFRVTARAAASGVLLYSPLPCHRGSR